MFCDGYRSTYNKAVERNIPLVSARWMEYSKLANKIQDPADYPPVGMEKYTTTPSRKIKIPVSNFQCLIYILSKFSISLQYSLSTFLVMQDKHCIAKKIL